MVGWMVLKWRWTERIYFQIVYGHGDLTIKFVGGANREIKTCLIKDISLYQRSWNSLENETFLQIFRNSANRFHLK